MAHSWMRLAAAVVVVATGTLALAGTARAQQPVNVPMAITENRVQGVAGQVTLTPQGNNLRVQIRLTGLAPNAEHAAHIHGAPGAVCDSGAPITHPLNNVRAGADGVGTSDSTVSVGADNPLRAQAYVNVHTAANPPGPGVICANVPASVISQAGAAPPAGQGGAQAMPRSGAGPSADGGTNRGMLAGALVVAVLALGVAGLRAASRRTR